MQYNYYCVVYNINGEDLLCNRKDKHVITKLLREFIEQYNNYFND